MRMCRIVWVAVLSVLALSRAGAAQPLATAQDLVTRYDGHAMVHVNASTPEDLARLESIGARMVSCELSPDGGDFVLPSAQVEALRRSGYLVIVEHENVQAMIDSSPPRFTASVAPVPPPAPLARAAPVYPL